MTQKPLADQMAALNNFDDTSDSASYADRSNSLLNATCPARIQNTSDGAANASLDCGYQKSSAPMRRAKRETYKFSPLEQIDEVPPRRNNSRYPESYKTKLCDAFRRQGYCPYNDDCPYAHGTDELRMPPRRKPFLRNIETTRFRKENADVSLRIQPVRHQQQQQHHENRRFQPNRQICKNFERGNCRYGPRCKYIHREQMPAFDQNASLFMPTDGQQITFYSNGTCFVPAQPVFFQQYAPAELNQTLPLYAPNQQLNATYYVPIAPTPVMDQAPTPQPLLMMPELPPPEAVYGPPETNGFRDNAYFQPPPPPPLMQSI